MLIFGASSRKWAATLPPGQGPKGSYTHTQRKELTMSHQAEQDKQPAETFSQQEGPQSNPTFRWASQQNLVDLSEEQLEGSEVLTLEQLEVIQGGALRRVNSAPAHLGIPRTPPS